MAVELGVGYITIAPSAKGIEGKIEKQLGGAGKAAANTTENAFRGAASKVGSGFKTALKGAALGGAAIFAGAAVGAKSAITAASDLSEAQSKVQAVFGDSASSIEKWAANSATAFGQSKEQALSAAGAYGNLFSAFGLGQQETEKMSKGLTELAADLASFNNTSIDEALQSLQSGVSGETEPLKKYGIAINDARLQAEALALGIGDGKAPLDAASKAQATYSLIMKDTTKAQGDFARTSDGLANKQRILGARFQDLQAKIGSALLPIVLKLADVFMEKVVPVLEEVGNGIKAFVAAFQDGGDEVTSSGLAGKLESFGVRARNAFDAIAPTIRNVIDWLKKNLPPAIETARLAFQRIVGWVQQNWPQIRSVIQNVLTTVQSVIQGVVTTVTVLWKNFGDNILAFVKAAWPPIQQVIKGVMDVIQGIIKTVTSIIQGDWSGAWNGIKQVVSGAVNAIVGIVRTTWEQLKSIIGVANEIIRSAISGAWRAIQSVISTALTAIKNAISTGITAVVNFFKALPGRVVSALGSLGLTLYNKGAELIGGMRRAIGDKVTELYRFFSQLPGDIVRWLGDMGSKLLGAGKELIAGFVRGIKDKIGDVKDTLTGLTSDVVGWKGPPEKDKKLLTPAGQMVIDGFLKGLESRYGAVRASLTGFTNGLDIGGPSFGAPSVPSTVRAAAPVAMAANPGLTGGAPFIDKAYFSEPVDVDTVFQKATFQQMAGSFGS